MKKHLLIVCGISILFMTGGCGLAVVGGAASGVYAVETDERTAGQMLDDSTITSKVNFAFINDSLVKARQIDVDTMEGNVLLTGVVETEAETARAVELAGKVPGVKRVDNNMQIGSKSLSMAMTDKQVGFKVKAQLIRESDIRSFNIDVDVEMGVVTLSGKVGSEALKARVFEIARRTSGVLKIVDNVTVAGQKP